MGETLTPERLKESFLENAKEKAYSIYSELQKPARQQQTKNLYAVLSVHPEISMSQIELSIRRKIQQSGLGKILPFLDFQTDVLHRTVTITPKNAEPVWMDSQSAYQPPIRDALAQAARA